MRKTSGRPEEENKEEMLKIKKIISEKVDEEDNRRNWSKIKLYKANDYFLCAKRICYARCWLRKWKSILF